MIMELEVNGKNYIESENIINGFQEHFISLATFNQKTRIISSTQLFVLHLMTASTILTITGNTIIPLLLIACCLVPLVLNTGVKRPIFSDSIWTNRLHSRVISNEFSLTNRRKL
jgi:hypothetical protein